MARRSNSKSTPRRSRNNRSGKQNSSRFLFVGVGLCAIALLGAVIWWVTRTSDYQFRRADLDKYVALTQETTLLREGASVYADMSNGMLSAYSSPQSQAVLQSVINKLAGSDAIKFYGLANQKISPLTLSHTQLYNYMLSSGSYTNEQAPIELTLQTIVNNQQPALLMTDFEEYKGGVIERAAYAKKYFIEWLAKGFNITFYKWAFTEGGKAKYLFLAVFDDNANRLNSLIANAVMSIDPSISSFVLGSRDFAYPIGTQYPSLKDGGNYHNSKGQDIVTAVMANGGMDDFISYAKPYASANGTQGQFAPLDTYMGAMAEYYPIGVKWTDAIANAQRMQEVGVPQEDIYTHLLRNLYINFGAQSGYAIDGIEVRVFDMQATMAAVAASGDSINLAAIQQIAKPEVNMVLSAGMTAADDLPAGWREVYVDFDSQFNGTLMGNIPAENLLRANIVIAQASPQINKADSFFSWEGNPSLANSIKETLMADTSNPYGRILYTYYLRTLAK